MPGIKTGRRDPGPLLHYSLMPILQVTVLAVVQGLTGLLAFGGAGLLFLTSRLLGWETESLSFDIILHVGTLIAVLLYFFRDWLQIVGQAFGIHAGHDQELKHNRGLLWLLAIGSIPVGVAGLAFHKQAESTWRNEWVIGGMLIAIGLVMWFAENARRKLRDMSTIHLPDALAIGLAQAIAVVPDCSRSG